MAAVEAILADARRALDHARGPRRRPTAELQVAVLVSRVPALGGSELAARVALSILRDRGYVL